MVAKGQGQGRGEERWVNGDRVSWDRLMGRWNCSVDGWGDGHTQYNALRATATRLQMVKILYVYFTTMENK